MPMPHDDEAREQRVGELLAELQDMGAIVHFGLISSDESTHILGPFTDRGEAEAVVEEWYRDPDLRVRGNESIDEVAAALRETFHTVDYRVVDMSETTFLVASPRPQILTQQ